MCKINRKEMQFPICDWKTGALLNLQKKDGKPCIQHPQHHTITIYPNIKQPIYEKCTPISNHYIIQINQ